MSDEATFWRMEAERHADETSAVACPNCAQTDYGLACQAALGGKCPDRVQMAVPGRMTPPFSCTACTVCDGSGVLRVPEPDGSGLYETACPDPSHGDVTFPDPGPVTTPLSDWDW
jgi:hypothetical protein